MNATFKKILVAVIGIFLSIGITSFLSGYFSMNISAIENRGFRFVIIGLLYYLPLSSYLFICTSLPKRERWLEESLDWYFPGTIFIYMIQLLNYKLNYGGSFIDEYAIGPLGAVYLAVVILVFRHSGSIIEKHRKRSAEKIQNVMIESAIALAKQTFYPGTSLKIGDYVIKYSQQYGATELIGWSGKAISDEIALVFYSFKVNLENRCYAFEVNTSTNTIHDALTDPVLKNFYDL